MLHLSEHIYTLFCTDGQVFLVNETILTVQENVDGGVVDICVALSSDGELETDVFVTMETFDGSAGEILCINVTF